MLLNHLGKGISLKEPTIIRMETVPCWYELSWRGEQGIVLRVHKEYAFSARPIAATDQSVVYYKEEFEFTQSSWEFGKDIGFGDSLKFLGEAGAFLEYSVPTPLARKDSGKKCYGCNGSGESKLIEGDKCQYCNGEGREFVWDYAEANVVCASLQVLLSSMRYPDVGTHSELPQLMVLETVLAKGELSPLLAGEYSREAVEWMKFAGRGEIPDMVNAMRAVWGKMDGGLKNFDEDSFRASLNNNSGWLCALLPGDGCVLHPVHGSEFNVSRGWGYEFSSHAVETVQQQLTILASLAALHDLMRR